MDNYVIRAKVLYALARKRKWGESHTAFEHVLRQFKAESLGKAGFKNAKNIAEDLMREGFIIKKPTSYGLQVSLNPVRAADIKRLIQEQLGFDV
ncbi:MAG: hypothetical protein HYY37_01200 [Candidatus Aenigmarchaeota archaeon]|nr:hypothetical protein [Candidatus Aenigmarchaeota archaeon]